MKKNFVLDTNILIHNPRAIEKFEDNNVWIVHPVVEELDSLKNSLGEVGYSAREAIRILTKYRKKGNLLDGVKLPNGGTLFLYVCEDTVSSLPKGWSLEKQDNLILFSILKLKKEHKNLVLVSNDGNMQLKADVLGIDVQFFQNDRVAVNSHLYTGRNLVYVDDYIIKKIQKNKKDGISVTDFVDNARERVDCFKIEAYNQFFILKSEEGSSILVKECNGRIIELEKMKNPVFNLTPRNAGQFFLKESLLTSARSHPLTIVNGPAGTGKTLFAIGCGLEEVIENNNYKRVLLCRPNVTMDEEIGFLPGSEKEKISPLLRGCYDNLEILLGNEDDNFDIMQDKIEEFFYRGIIDTQAVAYLRGRSITDTFIIIDEAQNATPNQILSIITRAGEGSKIIIMGDINQIDSPRLDSQNNGLSYAIEKMKGSHLCHIVSFEERECTRSALAKEASERLKK